MSCDDRREEQILKTYFGLDKKDYQDDLDNVTEEESQILKTYFDIDIEEPAAKYKRLYPNMYKGIINKLVEEEILYRKQKEIYKEYQYKLQLCKNRGERRSLTRETIIKQKKNNM